MAVGGLRRKARSPGGPCVDLSDHGGVASSQTDLRGDSRHRKGGPLLPCCDSQAAPSRSLRAHDMMTLGQVSSYTTIVQIRESN